MRRTADPTIFLEKVRRPVLRGLVRDRLDGRLVDLLTTDSGCSCVLVLAPPGAGKTTLLSQLVERSVAPAAWYRAGAEDSDERALTRHLGYTLGLALADAGLADVARSGRVEELVRRLDAGRFGPVRLVIDDLHEIAGSPAEQALELFLRLRPRSVTVVLGSRRQPGLNTSRLLVSGELAMVDGDDLRFRSWEVEQLFRSVYDAPLSPEAAAALTRRTGGWAAGLQLFHLATAQLSRAERERAVTELSGRSRLIRSYLARNVLDGLSDERRHFLMRTAALGVLTGDLCDDLLQTHDSAAVLAELEREQFFTTSSDGGLTYHYHQVLQTHLEVALSDELGGGMARELYARSARLLEQAARPADALRAYARAEDWGAVARLLGPDTEVVAGDDAVWRLLSRSGAVTDDPGLALANARRLARDGQLQAAVDAYRQAAALLDDRGFEHRCAAEGRAIGIWLPQSTTATLPPAPPATDPESALLRQSLELRRMTRDVRDPKCYPRGWRRGLAYVLAGDLTKAEREFAAPPAPIPGAPAWEPLAAGLAACLPDAIQQPDSALAGRIEAITLAAELEGWPWLGRLGRSLQAMVQVRSGGVWQGEMARDLLARLSSTGDRWSQLLIAVGVAVAAARAGVQPVANEAGGRAVQLAGEFGAPSLLALIDHSVPLDHSAPPSPVVEERRVVPSTRIELRCLGGFGLRIDGTEIGWRSLRPKARMLLMLLALHYGQALHRERIIEALWPDAALSSGIRSLQVAVSSIRQCLSVAGVPGDAIRRQGDAYELRLADASSDVVEFQRLAASARRRDPAEALAVRTRALELYRGDLLPEVGPAEWVVEERDRLRLLAATTAAAAAGDAMAVDDPATGIEFSRRSIALDPFHDPAWKLVITAYESVGDLSAAAIARTEHRRVWDDLGLAVGG
ncbi:MAG: BTAD domain-containing putative transcriptional regulator [Microlunatus sp.]